MLCHHRFGHSSTHYSKALPDVTPGRAQFTVGSRVLLQVTAVQEQLESEEQSGGVRRSPRIVAKRVRATMDQVLHTAHSYDVHD